MKVSDLIDGRYRLERLLGTGGMSEVWLAEDQRLSRWVAVKILRDSVAGAAAGELVDSIEREARVIARLQHPNIVAVHDAGKHEGHHFLVMEYVHGFSVRQLVESQGRLGEAEAILYGSQVASALQYAHEQGVIHCDVKPENILINENGVAKVADFGVADTVTRTLAPEAARAVLGTIAYLAPEVIQGFPADPRSDVYSLALTVYEMVAGRLPFAGATPAATAGQRLAMQAPPLRTLALSASAELESVLAKALALLPHDRYASAAEFGAGLRRAESLGSAVARPPVTAPPGRSPGPMAKRGSAARRRHDTTPIRRRAAERPSASGRRAGNLAMWISIGVILLGAGAAAAGAYMLAGDRDEKAPAPTPTATVTPTPTRRPPPTATASATATRTVAPSPSPSPTPTRTPSPSPTATRTPSVLPTVTVTATQSPSPSVSPSP